MPLPPRANCERHPGCAGSAQPVQPMQMKRMKRNLAVLAALVLTASVSLLHAATHVWSGAVNGYWSNAGNWSSGGTPSPGEAPPVVLTFPFSATRHMTTNDIGSLLLGYLAVDQVNLMGSNYVVAGKGGGTNLYLSGYYHFPSVQENVYCAGA